MDLNNNFTLSEEINGPILAAVIGIEMLTGLITNSFVLILTFCYLKTMKQPSTIFLTNMLLANLTIAVLMMPFPIITSACGQWIIGSTLDQKNGVCQFVAIMNWYCAAVSTESLMLVSFDRFFFIVKALQYKKYMTVNKAVIIVAVSWILAAFLCVIPLLGFGVYEFAHSYGTCVPGFDGQFEFTIFSFILSTLLIGSIFITSTWTCIFMRKYLKTRSHRKNFMSSHSQKIDVYVSQERKLIGLFGMLILVYFVCYSPFLILALIVVFVILPPIPYTVAFVMFLMLCSLSPLVQAYFRTDIRSIIKDKFTSIIFGKGHCAMNGHIENNTTVTDL